MSIKKQVLKSKPICKVSFKVSKEQSGNAAEVAVLGDFNEWNPTADVMSKLKDGSFSHTIELATGSSYSFRYLADGAVWFDEPEADGHEAGEFGANNNVINT
ncbi:MAG: isoamylase early set domain-containing protein [Bacteroidetes bacterium]|jgi:1,4-alpha-glucan branching enzyme|nr:isoamylase early set domain-containing protein [Bacteroidota bacterium]